MKKFILILVLLVLVSCEKEFKTLQRSYVISNFIELNDDLDYKLIYYCDKYSAFEHFYDIKHTIFNEIGEHNYYKSAETRMAIVSHTKDTGTCQFQHKTFYYLANKYNLYNANILNENHQIAVMVLAFKDGKQNWWCGYKKYKNSIEYN
jgi:hypothetical protein